jgi:hypothetical protein
MIGVRVATKERACVKCGRWGAHRGACPLRPRLTPYESEQLDAALARMNADPDMRTILRNIERG